MFIIVRWKKFINNNKKQLVCACQRIDQFFDRRRSLAVDEWCQSVPIGGNGLDGIFDQRWWTTDDEESAVARTIQIFEFRAH